MTWALPEALPLTAAKKHRLSRASKADKLLCNRGGKREDVLETTDGGRRWEPATCCSDDRVLRKNLMVAAK